MQHVTGHVSKYAESFNERWLADALHPLGAAAFAALDRGGAAEFDTGARTTSDSLVCSGAVYVPRDLGFFEHNGRKTNFITNIMAMAAAYRTHLTYNEPHRRCKTCPRRKTRSSEASSMQIRSD